jgi:hypothetical protein
MRRAWLVIAALATTGFTQSGVGTVFGNAIPMGHEWITRVAALELLGGDPVMQPDAADPRAGWTKGNAKRASLAGAEAEVKRITSRRVKDGRYESAYAAVLAAIIGERWVDIAGFNITKAQAAKYNCFDAVAQEAADVQYDHFMRRYDDVDGAGGVTAAERSRDRFVQYFVAAATAPAGDMAVWDGGAYSARVTVDRNYFLFGRAVHLFEDSFSPEHTVRLPADNFERVHQVKSYLCAAGSEQHSHAQSAIFDYSSGDVIWKQGTRFAVGWKGYRASNLKPIALVAIEATKDLWAAFVRTMAAPADKRATVARAEATQLADAWMAFDKREMTAWYDDAAHRDATFVRSVPACMKQLGHTDQQKRAQEIETQRRICLYNILPATTSDPIDPALRVPYDWKWRAMTWKTPPADWQPL